MTSTSASSDASSFREPDVLQKILDGVATPAELRAAESSTYVPDEIIVQAAKEYEQRLRDGAQANPGLSLPIKENEDDNNSLFDDDFFNTDPFWTIPNGSSTPNTSVSQILCGDDRPQEDLVPSEPSAVSSETGDRILQAAMNSMADVSETTPGDLPPDQLLDEDVPTRNLTGDVSHTTSKPSKSTRLPRKKGKTFSPPLRDSRWTPTMDSPTNKTSQSNKRRILDDSDDSLNTSRPNEKNLRLSEDDEDEDSDFNMDLTEEPDQLHEQGQDPPMSSAVRNKAPAGPQAH